jgi:alpha-tubulin suppressor-like RCC1 family protein
MPAQAVGLITRLSAAPDHTCALSTGGGVKCWGLNEHGQLGDGTSNNSPTPVDVIGLTSGIAEVSAGYSETCSLSTGGGVKCWGYNADGQLGDGTTNDSTTPVDVVGLSSGIAALSTGPGGQGAAHACAVTTGGDVMCWGGNYGSTPVLVASPFAAVSAGQTHTCALTTGHGVKCWGSNNNGQLGDGTTTDSTSPVDVSGLSSGVAAISAGYQYTCALTIDGGAKCWGFNGQGRLGDGTTTDSSVPVDVSGLSSGVTAISASEYHTCALTTAGGVKCWGYNNFGMLGDGTTSTSSTPVDVSGLTSGVEAMSAGGEHTCAITTDRIVRCWGHNNYGALGDGTMADSPTPVDVPGIFAISYRPDGLLAQGPGSFVGNNIYSTAGAGETRSANISRGKTTTFRWRVQNDGALADRVVFKGSGDARGFRVQFFYKGSDVTKSVVAGTYKKPLASGVSLTVTVRITVAIKVPSETVKYERLRTTSTHQPISDTVLAKVTAR